jgi:hypothetical protein
LVLDNADTTSLTVTGAAGAYTLATGNITGTDGLTGYTVSSSTASGTVTTGTMVDADSLESLTVTASAANVTVGAIGGTGTGEVLSSVTLSATGATADVDDITADTTNSATDNAMTITATATTGSTVTTGDINNQFGSIALTVSGEGTFNIGGTDGSEMLTFGQASTFDMSGSTGTTELYIQGGTALGTVTLAVQDSSDTVGVSDNGSTSITNFQSGASGDVIAIDISETGSAISDSSDTAITAATAIDLVEITAATDISTATDNVIVLTGITFATTALVETAVESGGARELDVDVGAGDDLMIVWSDGTNTYIGVLDVGTATDGALGAGDTTLTVVAELVGVDCSTAGTLVAANFDFI